MGSNWNFPKILVGAQIALASWFSHFGKLEVAAKAEHLHVLCPIIILLGYTQQICICIFTKIYVQIAALFVIATH